MANVNTNTESKKSKIKQSTKRPKDTKKPQKKPKAPKDNKKTSQKYT